MELFYDFEVNSLYTKLKSVTTFFFNNYLCDVIYLCNINYSKIEKKKKEKRNII